MTGTGPNYYETDMGDLQLGLLLALGFLVGEAGPLPLCQGFLLDTHS